MARRSTSAVSSSSSSAAASARVASTAATDPPYLAVSREIRSRRRSTVSSRAGSCDTARRVVARHPGQLGEVGKGGVEHLAPRRHVGIDPLQRRQRPVGVAQGAQGTGLLAVEQLGHPLGVLDQRAGVPEPPGLDLQRSSSPGHQPGAVDFGDDVAQVVGPPPHLVPPRREASLLLRQRDHLAVPCGDRLALRGGAGEGVEDVALGVGPQQRLGLVLAVEVHQRFAEPARARRSWWGCR